MIVLGIDPGTANIGFGILKIPKNNKRKIKCVEYGVIHTNLEDSPGKRLKKIDREISKLIRKNSPEIIVLESLYFSKNKKTAMSVSQAYGVMFLIAEKKKVQISQLTPLQIKQAVTGYGWASKLEVQEKVRAMLKLNNIPKPDHAADALAAAIAYIKNSSKESNKSLIKQKA